MDESLRLPPKKPVGELIWVAGGEVDECSVSLRFFGDNLDPDIITKTLDIAPTISYRKGDILRGKTYDKIQSTGSWRYRTQRHTDISLEDLIEKLFDRLTNDIAVWQDLTSKLQADLFCGLWLKRWNRSIDFKPSILMKIAERGLKIGLDIYFESDEDK